MKKELDDLTNLITESLSKCQFSFKVPDELIKHNIAFSKIILTDFEYINGIITKGKYDINVCRLEDINNQKGQGRKEIK